MDSVYYAYIFRHICNNNDQKRGHGFEKLWKMLEKRYMKKVERKKRKRDFFCNYVLIKHVFEKATNLN